MIKWFKKLLYIVKHFDDINSSIDNSLVELRARQSSVEYCVTDAVQTIKDRTTLHADVSPYHRNGNMSQIILIGRYRNRDFIQTFEVLPDDFNGLVHQCIDMQKYAHMGRIDAVPMMKEIIETESEKYWGTL